VFALVVRGRKRSRADSRPPGPQIWSIRFSADQKEIIAGAGSGQIMVYDIAAKRRILNIRAHNADGKSSV
jgi:hypothetical protein